MLKDDTLIARSKKDFDQSVKKIFVNMQNNVRTVHLTNNRSCPHSKCASKFITFDTLDELVAYEQEHKQATPFKRCGNCF